MTAEPKRPPLSEDEGLEELEQAWNERGPAAIRTIATLEPARYLALFARLLADPD